MEIIFVFTLLVCLYVIGATFLYYLIALHNTNKIDEEEQFAGVLCLLSWVGIILAVMCYLCSRMVIIFWPEPTSNDGNAGRLKKFKPKLK